MFGRKCNWHKLKNLSVVLGIFALSILTIVAVYGEWKARETLVWEDNFNFFNDTKWRYIITGNRGNESEFQYYRRDKRNSYVKDGILHLRATLVSDELLDEEIRSGSQIFPGCNIEPCLLTANRDGDSLLPVYSAYLHTRDLFEMRQGRLEVKARFPSGDWLRAQITLLPRESAFGGWSSPEEICIADICGNKNLTTVDGRQLDSNALRQSFHFNSQTSYNTSDNNGNRKALWETAFPKGGFNSDFHVLEVDWTTTTIVFRVDGRETRKITQSEGYSWDLAGFTIRIPDIFKTWINGGSVIEPFGHPFSISMKLSVGGKIFEEDFKNLNYPKPWNYSTQHPITQFYENAFYYAQTWVRPELEVDYIRVYEH